MSSIHTRLSGTTAATKTSSTAPLYRRLLFPHLAPSVDVPPVLPNASAELNHELHDFLALALRAYISPWWSKITRFDKDFIPHVSVVITAVVQRLAGRLQSADISPLVFRDLPALITQHYVDLRAAQAKLGTSYALGGASSLPQMFHQLQPHMAIDSEGHVDPIYTRQVVDHILRTCLPPEDYESEAERAIICEVVCKVLLVDVLPRLAEPWFISKLLLDTLTGGSPTEKPDQLSQPEVHRPLNLHSVVVFFLSAVQSISGLGLAIANMYKDAKDVIKRVNSSALTSRPFNDTASPDNEYAMCLSDLIREVLATSDRAAAAAFMNIFDLCAGLFRTFINRLLQHALHTQVLSPANVLFVVKSAKKALFPNGYPGPPPVEPTPEEQAILQEELVRHIDARVPALAGAVLLGSSLSPSPVSLRQKTIRKMLEPFSDQICNMHLLLLALDLIMLYLFPEMGPDSASGKGATTDIDPGVVSASASSSVNTSEADSLKST